MKTRTLQTALLTALAWTVFALSATGQALAPVQDSPDGPWYMPGEILIKFKAEATDAQLQDAIRRAGVGSAKHIQTRAMKAHGDHGITRADTDQPVAQAIKALQNHPAVEYAQPNWVYRHQAVSNDPYFTDGSLWGMYGATTTPANQYGSGAAAAWAAGSVGSSSVYIGIIDEGIQFDHPDLAANMWVNPDEIAGDGKDNDGNGYIDDVHGCNAINNNGNIYDSRYDDHGTHVAGTIGAVANNDAGVVGVSWNVKLISGKFLGPRGGTTADAAQAIDYMTDLKSKGVNIVALNNSWGGGGYDPALLGAIVRAAAAQILFVAAAGNGDSLGVAINNDLSPYYPAGYNTQQTVAGYDSVIAVTAIDPAGAKASWANYGVSAVDLGAPGVGIWSTMNKYGYGSNNGTSMATPHVTGAIALYAAQYPYASAADIRNALMSSTISTPSLVGKTVTGGRLAIPLFLSPPTLEKPTPPTWKDANPITAISPTAIRLAWIDSDRETSYKITRYASDGTTVLYIKTLPSDSTTYTDTGLVADSIYSYSLEACNANGCVAADAKQEARTLTAAASAAVFKGVDDITKGNWINKYGTQGYDIIGTSGLGVSSADFSKGFGAVTPFDNLSTFWETSTTQVRGLQVPLDGTERVAWCYYTATSSSSFGLDVNLKEGNHKVSLYCVDWDSTVRRQRIEVIDYNHGTVLSTVYLSSFSGGQYLVWNVTGHVTIKITCTGGANGVVSGIFLDEVGTGPTIPPIAPSGLTAKAISKNQIDLAWVDNSTDETGFKIERSTSATTGFTEIGVALLGATSYQDTGLTANTTYYYRVRATVSGADSIYSNTAWTKTLRR